MNPAEIEAAVRAGAELVLSVNSANRAAAVDWGCEVVVVPDDPATLAGLDETIEFLAQRGVPLRIDPILEPIGFGFAASLGRYLDVRRRYPDAEMMMGIGNLTELTDADSAGDQRAAVGVLPGAGHSQRADDPSHQLGPHQRPRVRPGAAAGLLCRAAPHAAQASRAAAGDAARRRVAAGTAPRRSTGWPAKFSDPNYRLFAEDGQLHAVTAGLHCSDADPFALFAKLTAAAPRPIDANHAFYLGYELAKAVTALTLGKDYRQDEALDWGLLTQCRAASPPRTWPARGRCVAAAVRHRTAE